MVTIAATNRHTDLKADKDIRVSPCIKAARNDDKAFLFQLLLRKTPCAGFIFVLPLRFVGKAAHFVSNCRVECNSIADARSTDVDPQTASTLLRLGDCLLQS